MSYVLGDGREARLSGPRSSCPGAVRCLVSGWILESDQTALSHFTDIFLFLSGAPLPSLGHLPSKAGSSPHSLCFCSLLPKWVTHSNSEFTLWKQKNC